MLLSFTYISLKFILYLNNFTWEAESFGWIKIFHWHLTAYKKYLKLISIKITSMSQDNSIFHLYFLIFHRHFLFESLEHFLTLQKVTKFRPSFQFIDSLDFSKWGDVYKTLFHRFYQQLFPTGRDSTFDNLN